jgi:hypothetical protein
MDTLYPPLVRNLAAMATDQVQHSVRVQVTRCYSLSAHPFSPSEKELCYLVAEYNEITVVIY